ncbi:MAG: hypothetical protein QOJ98_1379 [Acidobacteriota bacterium]|jgi:hypothetical protein|nr:hypothetical protein [Acidobacteriota bacterium]
MSSIAKAAAIGTAIFVAFATDGVAQQRRRQFSFYHASRASAGASQAISQFAGHTLDRLRFIRPDVEVRVFASDFPLPEHREAVAARNRALALVESEATPDNGGFRIRNRVYLGLLQEQLQFEPVVIELLYSPNEFGTAQDVFTALAEYAMAVEERRALTAARTVLTPGNTGAMRNRLILARDAVTTAERRENRTGRRADLLRHLGELRRAIDEFIAALPSGANR